MALRSTILFLVCQAGHCRHHDVIGTEGCVLQIICQCQFCRHVVVNIMYFDDTTLSVGNYEVAQSCKLLEDSFIHNCMLY